MVTMMTDIMGSPIRRRRNILSMLMARKKVMIMLARKEKRLESRLIQSDNR